MRFGDGGFARSIGAPDGGVSFGFGGGYAIALLCYLLKLGAAGVLLGVFEMSIAKMRVFRVPNFLGAALMLSLLGVLLLFVSGGM